MCVHTFVSRCDVPIHTYSKYICSRIVTKEMAAFSSHLGAFSSHLCRVPTIQFQFISISRVHTIQLQAIVSRVHTIQRSFMQEPMWSCAIPRPKVVQSVPCSAQESQLHWGYKQRTSLLNCGILNSTGVPYRKRRRTEEKGTLLAKHIDLTSMCCINTR